VVSLTYSFILCRSSTAVGLGLTTGYCIVGLLIHLYKLSNELSTGLKLSWIQVPIAYNSLFLLESSLNKMPMDCSIGTGLFAPFPLTRPPLSGAMREYLRDCMTIFFMSLSINYRMSLVNFHSLWFNSPYSLLFLLVS